MYCKLRIQLEEGRISKKKKKQKNRKGLDKKKEAYKLT